MATLIFQRATWCLQISRTSRTFSISFTTALPRRHRLPNLPNPSIASHRAAPTSRTSRHHQARTAFTSTKVYREQQAASVQVHSRLLLRSTGLSLTTGRKPFLRIPRSKTSPPGSPMNLSYSMKAPGKLTGHALSMACRRLHSPKKQQRCFSNLSLQRMLR